MLDERAQAMQIRRCGNCLHFIAHYGRSGQGECGWLPDKYPFWLENVQNKYVMPDNNEYCETWKKKLLRS